MQAGTICFFMGFLSMRQGAWVLDAANQLNASDVPSRKGEDSQGKRNVCGRRDTCDGCIFRGLWSPRPRSRPITPRFGLTLIFRLGLFVVARARPALPPLSRQPTALNSGGALAFHGLLL